jgi:hypothetical protein
MLGEDPNLPGVRVGELIEPLGWDGGKTILDDYLREIRPLFQTTRTTQRTIYRPGEICQFDVWEPEHEVPVGHGQTRRIVSWSPALATRAPGRAPWSSASRRRICWPASEELRLMAPRPETVPDTDRRWVLRVSPDPYVRFAITRWTLTWSAAASRSA